MTATNINTSYEDLIRARLKSCLNKTEFDFGKRYAGKVRETYDLGETLMLITSDRLSAFDRHLASIPCKGEVLNLTSAWWFEKTKHLVPNHVIAVPDPNVTIAKKCDVFPIEFVVRGYITGTTSTSLWTQYNQGSRNYCGIALPEGLRKNEKLANAVLTPTTKEKEHDRPISPKEIVAENWMNQADWDQASEYALKLFNYGQQVASEHGLILVDTKYEFGRDSDGQIILVDEIHTPDSSRYWLQHSYAERFAQGLEPENIDKEFLRLWFKANCDPYKDDVLPKAPDDLIVMLASRYIQLYEMITNKKFIFHDLNAEPNAVCERILKNVKDWV